MFQLPIDPQSQPSAPQRGLVDELRSIEETCQRHLAVDLIPSTVSGESFGSAPVRVLLLFNMIIF